MKDAINWFEIPASDFARAKDFYSTLYGAELSEWEMNGLRIAFIPLHSHEGVGGAIVHGEGYEPSDKGVMVYLNAGDDMAPMLDRARASGGRIITPKTLVDCEIGYMAVIRDSEGNRVALHSRH